MSGFFDLDWAKNATLEIIIEGNGFNDTLAGYDNCNNSNLGVSAGGANATKEWTATYLQNATERLQQLSPDYNWTVSDTLNAQSLCPYETVALGYSAFCDLFTYEEWQGYEYGVDLTFAGGNMFQSPTGRAVGIGFVEETLAVSRPELRDVRGMLIIYLQILNNHLLTTADTQANVRRISSMLAIPADVPLDYP